MNKVSDASEVMEYPICRFFQQGYVAVNRC